MPTPKEFVKQVLMTVENFVDKLLEPAEAMARSMGLPELPKPPRASDMIDNLPDLPDIQAIIQSAPLPLPAPQPQTSEAVVEMGGSPVSQPITVEAPTQAQEKQEVVPQLSKPVEVVVKESIEKGEERKRESDIVGSAIVIG